MEQAAIEPPRDPEKLPDVPARKDAVRRGGRPPLPKHAKDRITLFSVRAIFFLTAAGLGLYGIQVVGAIASRTDLDPIWGILTGCATAIGLILLEIFFSGNPIRTLSAITFGLIVGMVLSLVFKFVIEFIVEAVAPMDVRLHPQFGVLLAFLQMIAMTIFCYFGVTVLLQTKEDFKFIIPYVEFRKDVRGQTPLIFDTSSFVDGRIASLLKTGILDHRLVVPTFVLNELQTIADSADRSLRERGRRGLDILHEIERTRSLEIVERSLAPGDGVDRSLVYIALELGGKIVTTDFNLQKNARLQGVSAININDVATAVKPSFVPGESLSVRLLREGDEKGQAVGFLGDGTMVVVEGSRHRLGQEVTVEVTSALQTSAGKMVFGRLSRPPRPPGGA